MIFAQTQPTGKTNVVSKSFATGAVTTLATDAGSPFATNLRLVYIKSGTTIGYARLDGVAKLLPQLTQPSDPTLSVDSRLICAIDKLSDRYQLLLLDTLGNKSVLYETVNQISFPSFSSDGLKIVFTENIAPNMSAIGIVTIASKTVHKLTSPAADFYDGYAAVTNSTVNFVRSHMIDSTLSSEIFSSDFSGKSVTQLTSFTSNWTTPTFYIRDLRKITNSIDSSSIICTSNYNSTNSDIYLYKIGGVLTRLMETDQLESYPNFIANYANGKN